MALVVVVLPPPVPIISTQLPTGEGQADGGYRDYVLYVPGVEFRLLVGKKIPEALEQSCICHHPKRPIAVYDLSPDIRNAFRNAINKSHKSRKLARWCPNSALRVLQLRTPLL